MLLLIVIDPQLLAKLVIDGKNNDTNVAGAVPGVPDPLSAVPPEMGSLSALFHSVVMVNTLPAAFRLKLTRIKLPV
jgi:hypothetical protein